MWSDYYLEIIGGASVVLAALIKLVPQIRELWVRLLSIASKVENKVSAKMALEESLKHMRRVRAVQIVLDSWVKKKGAQRCLLLTANNGGEAWSGKGPLFVSNPAQVVGPGEPNTIDLWQNWKCDGWYCDFLGKLLETYKSQRGYALIVDNENVSGELLTQYTAQGTCASLVLPFKWKEGSVLWYVSINFGRSTAKHGEIEDDERREFAAAMRDLYRNPAKCRSLIQELEAAFDSVR